MLRATCLVALLALLASPSEGAVLVRFINTVPQRMNRLPLTGDEVTPAAVYRANGYDPVGVNGVATTYNPAVDRVGLYYFPAQSSKTVVWTEIADETRTEFVTAGAQSPYAYTFAMPPLRGFHKLNDPKTPYTDTVSTYLAAQNTENGITNDPSICGLYEQSTLKADGVSGYLSFAPGTYKMAPYAVLGTGTGTTNPTTASNGQTVYSFNDQTFTFEDNKVYTLIAYGNGALSASTITSGHTVQLALITESVAPADFGKAAVRFFHAVERASAVQINIGMGTSTVVSNIGFGSVSAYTNIKATKSVHFSVSRSDSPTKDETDITQLHDLRAGLRATLICAVNNLEAPSVFCRMIPSRVVAYVRLVHDAADKQQLVQGKFGPQKLSETKLTLWASFEYPRPWDTQQWSQDLGQVTTTGHPLTTRGLYPVVQNVAANTVSGYGEVHVPLFIMDFAVRTVVGFSTSAYTAAGGATNVPANRGAGPTADDWFHYAPIFKRVSFVIKTDGYATVAGDQGTILTFAGDNGYHVGYWTLNANNLATSLMTDLYVEPGEFYTVFAIGNGVQNRPTQLLKLQSDGMIRIQVRKDLSVDDVHNDLPTDQGSIVFVPFARRLNQVGVAPGVGASQAFLNVKISGTGASATTTTRSWTNTAVEVRSPLIDQVFTAPWPAVAQHGLLLAAGTYTYSQDATSTCDATVPTGTVTIAQGVRTEVFVLNTEGCLSNSNSLAKLVTVQTTFQSATASGHAPTITNVGSRQVRDVPLYSAASSSSVLALLVAALLAMAVALLA